MKKLKIVVLDGYAENPGDLSWDPISKFGDFAVYDRTSPQDVISRIRDAEIVFSNKVLITKEIIDSCPNLKYIGVLATGYNVIDHAYAAEKGIAVTNIPAYGTAAVAQYAIALLLELCHRVAHHSNEVFSGRWQKEKDFCFWDFPLMELDGKTMGIIGFGRIGRATAKIAKALGMKILASGSRPCEEGLALGEYVELDELLAKSDVISLHCPLFPETANIINKETISKMKDGAIIINTGRGGLVDEQAVCDALNSDKLRGFAADVVSTEPIRDDNPLLKAKNCIITPHIAWAPKESRQRIMDMAAQNLGAFLEGAPINVINNVK